MRSFSDTAFVVDEKNEKAVAFKNDLEVALMAREILIHPSRRKQDIKTLIAIGGDGTILRGAHTYNLRPAVLGINCGHVGFLSNDGDPETVADRFFFKNWQEHNFPLLEAQIDGGKKYLAINDIYFKSIANRACKVNVKVNGIEIAPRIAGDGIIVSTALGSTGYFVPVGGSAVNPRIPAICLAPSNVHTPLQFLPMILPLESRIEIDVLSPPEEILGGYDGLDLPRFKKINIRVSRRGLKLIFWKGENFTKRLIEKIMKVREVKSE